MRALLGQELTVRASCDGGAGLASRGSSTGSGVVEASCALVARGGTRAGIAISHAGSGTSIGSGGGTSNQKFTGRTTTSTSVNTEGRGVAGDGKTVSDQAVRAS